MGKNKLPFEVKKDGQVFIPVKKEEGDFDYARYVDEYMKVK